MELSFVHGGGPGTVRFFEVGDELLSQFPGVSILMIKGFRVFCDAAGTTRTDYYAPGYVLSCSAPETPPSISLSGPAEIRPPASKDAVSTTTITVKVTANGQPKAGVAVTLSNTVDFTSGGHTTGHTSPRPVAALNDKKTSITLSTDAQGEAKFTFTAPQAAGQHTIKAECQGCASPATHSIKVRVPNLVELTADTLQPARYILVGNTGSPGKNHVGNHWFTSQSRSGLFKVIEVMRDSGWGQVGVNDGNLEWGGLFDIYGNWAPSHESHREGNEVDISFSRPTPPSSKQKKTTYDKLCEKGNTALDVQTLWHKDDGFQEHYHLYLDGTGLRKDAGGKCCTQVKQAKKDKLGQPVLNAAGKAVMATACE